MLRFIARGFILCFIKYKSIIDNSIMLFIFNFIHLLIMLLSIHSFYLLQESVIFLLLLTIYSKKN